MSLLPARNVVAPLLQLVEHGTLTTSRFMTVAHTRTGLSVLLATMRYARTEVEGHKLEQKRCPVSRFKHHPPHSRSLLLQSQIQKIFVQQRLQLRRKVRTGALVHAFSGLINNVDASPAARQVTPIGGASGIRVQTPNSNWGGSMLPPPLPIGSGSQKSRSSSDSSGYAPAHMHHNAELLRYQSMAYANHRTSKTATVDPINLEISAGSLGARAKYEMIMVCLISATV